MQEITTNEQLHKAFKEPLAILFKHSTQCPISARAYEEMEKVPSVYLVKVIESRPISNAIAQKTGVTHESPQVIVLKKGKLIWHASHFDVTADKIKNLES